LAMEIESNSFEDQVMEFAKQSLRPPPPRPRPPRELRPSLRPARGGRAQFAAFCSSSPYCIPVWHEGFGPLRDIASGVTLIGQEGVVLAGGRDRPAVESEGASFLSM